ncbi:YIP1 family protein [Terriglobus roseus]|uniref:Yip1 domain-containing protein n=1 Tax=Terriglobus roseus TaxID=392734 RepID=A0A1G7QLK9_9BACT|nr:YIP1 family protein [Terriglobus roseus]SDF99403.1 Yip1 domain-containing protein [Terriglobus roseus]
MSAYPEALPPGPIDQYDNQPPLTAVQRITNIFYAPSKTFADLRRNRSWWLAFVVMALVGYLFTTTALTKVGPRGLAESSIRNNPAQAEKMQNASPEDRARMISITASIMQVSLWAWPVFILITAAIGALLLWVGCNFILGGSGTYPGMFAVMIFAYLPGIFRSLLTSAVLLFGDTENFNLNDPIGTNPGFYLGADSSVFLKTFLSSVDVFSLWILILMGIGGAIVARVKVKNGVAMVLITWLIFALGKAAITAATS